MDSSIPTKLDGPSSPCQTPSEFKPDDHSSSQVLPELKFVLYNSLHSRASETGSNSNFQQALSKMRETGKRPSHPLSAYCLFSSQRREQLRSEGQSTHLKSVIDQIKKEWRQLKNKKAYKDEAQKRYDQYKLLLKTWRQEFQTSKEDLPTIESQKGHKREKKELAKLKIADQRILRTSKESAQNIQSNGRPRRLSPSTTAVPAGTTQWQANPPQSVRRSHPSKGEASSPSDEAATAPKPNKIIIRIDPDPKPSSLALPPEGAAAKQSPTQSLLPYSNRQRPQQLEASNAQSQQNTLQPFQVPPQQAHEMLIAPRYGPVGYRMQPQILMVQSPAYIVQGPPLMLAEAPAFQAQLYERQHEPSLAGGPPYQVVYPGIPQRSRPGMAIPWQSVPAPAVFPIQRRPAEIQRGAFGGALDRQQQKPNGE